MKNIIKKIIIISSIIAFSYITVNASWTYSNELTTEEIATFWWWGLIFLAYVIYQIKIRNLIKKAKKDLEKAFKKYPSWNIESLNEITKEVFFNYKSALQKKDLSSIKKYMTNSFYEESKILTENKLIWKINIIKDIKINKLTLVSVKDVYWKSWDMFAMEVSENLIDYTIDENSWKFISSRLRKEKYESRKAYEKRAKTESWDFKEYYIFIRYKWEWLLNNITDKYSLFIDAVRSKNTNLKEILEKRKD